MSSTDDFSGLAGEDEPSGKPDGNDTSGSPDGNEGSSGDPVPVLEEAIPLSSADLMVSLRKKSASLRDQADKEEQGWKQPSLVRMLQAQAEAEHFAKLHREREQALASALRERDSVRSKKPGFLAWMVLSLLFRGGKYPVRLAAAESRLAGATDAANASRSQLMAAQERSAVAREHRIEVMHTEQYDHVVRLRKLRQSADEMLHAAAFARQNFPDLKLSVQEAVGKYRAHLEDERSAFYRKQWQSDKEALERAMKLSRERSQSKGMSLGM